MKSSVLIIGLLVLLFALPLKAQTVALGADNAISGGFGFQAGLSNWTPGGFKWFNDYSRKLSQLVWLNFQANVTLGDTDDRHCWHDDKHHRHCDYNRWDGSQVDFVIGVRLSWYLSKLPLEIYAKLGGAVDLLLLGFNYTGIAFGFRGGVGANFFFFPNFGVGLALLTTLGPSVISNGPDAEFYCAIDFQVIGVEYRF